LLCNLFDIYFNLSDVLILVSILKSTHKIKI
jgi:hypothetical protein